MPDELDTAAGRVRRELIEIAVDQISKPIAHEFDIRIVLDQSVDGAQSVLVEASSRSVQPVLTRVRVDVRPAGDGLVVERAGTDHRREVTIHRNREFTGTDGAPEGPRHVKTLKRQDGPRRRRARLGGLSAPARPPVAGI